jgi:DNA-binding transcriptional ArsR family regulator
MKQDYITATLSELGNETRLAIFRLLIKLGNDGATVGEIVKRLKVPPAWFPSKRWEEALTVTLKWTS